MFRSSERRLSPAHAAGFTLVELLVVIAIIGVLASLMIPAVGVVREAARNTTCKNNLRQLGIAVQHYTESNKEFLPPLWASNRSNPWENFSWRAELLPYLEQSNLYERLDKSQLPLDAEINLPLTQLRVPSFECPSTPGSGRQIRTLGYGETAAVDCNVASSDYVAVFDVQRPDRAYPAKGVWNGGGDVELEFEPPTEDTLEQGMAPNTSNRVSRERRNVAASLAAVRDGLSNTILVVEQAGKPNVYGANTAAVEFDPTEGAWATAEMSSFTGERINTNNRETPFGFHNSANVVMCDATVHSLSAETSPEVLRALMTSSGREVINENDWR